METDFINNYKNIIGGLFFLSIVGYSLYGVYRSIVKGGKISYRIQGSITALIALFGFILNFLDVIPFSVSMLLSILLFYIDVAVTKTFTLNELKKELLEGENSIRNRLNSKINELESQLNVFKVLNNNTITHPLYTTKENFKPVIENLFNLTTTQNQALKFSEESLREITERGFIKIDISFKEYTALLCELTKTSKSDIVGTYTVRPKKIEENKTALKDYVTELDNAVSRGVSIFRLMVFELNEITDILNNHRLNESKGIEELEQFEKQVSSSKIKWSSTPLFLSNLNENTLNNIIAPHQNDKFMTDFAIFDKELLILWRENDKKYFRIEEKTGTLLLNWNDGVKELSNKLNGSLNYVFDSFENVLECLNSLNDDTKNNLSIDSKEFRRFQTALKNYQQTKK